MTIRFCGSSVSAGTGFPDTPELSGLSREFSCSHDRHLEGEPAAQPERVYSLHALAPGHDAPIPGVSQEETIMDRSGQEARA
jgi:hypothetical protein